MTRTLSSHSESNGYFGHGGPLLHVDQRQRAFIDWHDEFFSGVRRAATSTTCGPYEIRKFGEFKIGVLPINTASFCYGDDDSGKLWVGRRCLDDAIAFDQEPVDLKIALMHHPLDWLHEIERTQITSSLYAKFNCILRGHLHQTELVRIDGTSGSALHLAAGAIYQGSSWPNKATFVEVYDEYLRVVPIRFDDTPSAAWNVDTSIFPDNDDFSGKLPWTRALSSSERKTDVIGEALNRPRVPVLQHPKMLPIAVIEGEEKARRNFEQDLFVSPSGNIIYVEPRLSIMSQDTISLANTEIPLTRLQDIVMSEETYIINVRSEYGGTSLSKRLLLDFTRAGVPAELRDSDTLPNYRAKLRNEFGEIKTEERAKRVLILDNYSFYRDEKLIKEIQSLGLFGRFIVLTTNRGVDIDIPSPTIGDRHAKILFLWSLSRAGVREMASALIDSADGTYLSAVVEKVYCDLLALSIPLTPSNVLMYLKVLAKEHDFHPFNRVDIVEKYLTGAVAGGSELLAGVFNSRDKIDILSEFAYGLFQRLATYFLDKDWFDFCDEYMKEKILVFSSRDLLRGLEEGRIVVRYEERLYFKYSFFFCFLVGRHLANRPAMVKSFVDSPRKYALHGVIETIVGLTSDGTSIIDHITTDLEAKLDEFARRFVPFDFDPMSKAEWLSNDKEEVMWNAISREVEQGPVSAAELDLIRASFRGEARTSDQAVRYSQLRELEIEVFQTSSILIQALKASHGIDGLVKKRAVIACLRVNQIGMQIGIILAREIAKRDWFQWGGALYIGFNKSVDEGDDEQSKAMSIISSIPNSVTAKVADDFGSRKLGEVFKATILDQDPESFLSLLIFGCLIRSKPPRWEECIRERIFKIRRNAFYLADMLEVLMGEYKTGVNTQSERESLKRLISIVHAKRLHGKAVPGAKLLREMKDKLERSGMLGRGRHDAAG